MTANPTPAARPEFSPLSLARTLYKRKLIVMAIWVIVAGGAAVVVQQLPAVYRSETTILVDSQKIPEKYVSPTINTDLRDRLASIREQILSSTRLNQTIADFDLYHEEKKSYVQEEIIEMMRKDIDITLEKGWSNDRPGAFRISYQGPVPATVAEVANRLATQFIDENLRNREVQSQGTSEFIQNQVVEAKKKLDELEAAVSRYKLAHNGELPQQEPALLGALSRLQLEMQGNQDAINRAQQDKVMLENALSTSETAQAALLRAGEARPSESNEGSATSDSQGLALGTNAQPRRRKKSELLQEQLDVMRIRYSDDHPDVKRLRDEIERLKSSEDKAAEPASTAAAVPSKTAPKSVSRPSPEAALELAKTNERIAGLKGQIKLNNHELENRTADRKRILDSIAAYQKHVDTLPVREQEMAAVTRDYETSKLNYRSLVDKKLAADMASDMEHRQKAESFKVIDPARVPEKPFKPNRPVFIAIGCIAGLVLGIAAGLGKELKQGVVLGEWELPAHVQIIGRVPRIEFERKTRFLIRFRGRRVAVVSSLVVSLLAIIAAGLYVASRHF
jgi:succinoglycan biosynthesis transport protein ExoP